MKFASLGSGSEGNALLISASSGSTRTTIMLDCGFGLRETEKRLARRGLLPSELQGIIVTHEHHDHLGGVFKFARRHRLPVWLTYGTWQAAKDKCNEVNVHLCRDGETFVIGDLEIRPYTVPHDAREPVQYVAHDGRSRLGVLTDAGHATSYMSTTLQGCDALLLECNHDAQMLEESHYPASLKHRIGGPLGHLSNESAADILAAIDQSKLRKVVGAHLSRHNNTPQLAKEALCGAIDNVDIQVLLACQEQGFDWITAGD